MVLNLLHVCPLDGGETPLSINSFDDGCRFFVVFHDVKQQEMGGLK
jgi:hypothetical protein